MDTINSRMMCSLHDPLIYVNKSETAFGARARDFKEFIRVSGMTRVLGEASTSSKSYFGDLCLRLGTETETKPAISFQAR